MAISPLEDFNYTQKDNISGTKFQPPKDTFPLKISDQNLNNHTNSSLDESQHRSNKTIKEQIEPWNDLIRHFFCKILIGCNNLLGNNFLLWSGRTPKYSKELKSSWPPTQPCSPHSSICSTICCFHPRSERPSWVRASHGHTYRQARVNESLDQVRTKPHLSRTQENGEKQ